MYRQQNYQIERSFRSSFAQNNCSYLPWTEPKWKLLIRINNIDKCTISYSLYHIVYIIYNIDYTWFICMGTLLRNWKISGSTGLHKHLANIAKNAVRYIKKLNPLIFIPLSGEGKMIKMCRKLRFDLFCSSKLFQMINPSW